MMDAARKMATVVLFGLLISTVSAGRVSMLSSPTSAQHGVQLKLLAAKDLIAANLNGSSDPYALITCGKDKRFRSYVQKK